MIADKFREIAHVHDHVRKLRADPHVKLCYCCSSDLDLVYEDPIGVVGRFLLKDVLDRCTRAATRDDA